MAFSLLRQGRLIPVPTVEQGERYAESRPEAAEQPPLRARLAGHGSGRASRRRRAEYGVDEVLLLTITYEHEARRRSYELIAGEIRGYAEAVAGSTEA